MKKAANNRLVAVATDPAGALELSRVSAAVDFICEYENDLWRQHVIATHGPNWPWRKKKTA